MVEAINSEVFCSEFQLLEGQLYHSREKKGTTIFRDLQP